MHSVNTYARVVQDSGVQHDIVDFEVGNHGQLGDEFLLWSASDLRFDFEEEKHTSMLCSDKMSQMYIWQRP
jgi:hypothetical protein